MSSSASARTRTEGSLVAALDRLEEVQALGAQGINLEGAPADRIRALAREAFSVKAQRVARRTPDRRLATRHCPAGASPACVHRSTI